ncbi:MAG TPA: hypothetical protein VEL75_02470, partial [Candidatus Methylomirabilis sp.]|nr:hypothetical protein [Candidatus Methylomirabilis sp.]
LMLPRLASPQFGLLDDGLIPVVSSKVLPEAAWQFDKASGRFRPLFWLGLVAQYRMLGPNPLAFFLVLYGALGATAVLIAEGVALAARNRLAGLLAALAYVLAPPAIENYYTISKSEPWLVLVLALSVYLLLRALQLAERDPRKSRRRLAAAQIVLLAAYFWKETAFAMLIVSGLWLAGTWCGDRRLAAPRSRIVLGYFLANAACGAIFWTAYRLSGTPSIGSGTYSVHYMLALDTMGKSALRHLGFAVRDFPLLIVASAVWTARLARGVKASAPARGLALGSLAWVVGWTVIMLPWRATFEYYLLPLSAGAAALTGVALAELFRGEGGETSLGWLSRAALAVGAVFEVAVLLNSASTGRIQLAVDAANAELLEFVAAGSPRDAAVLVNLPEGSEYVNEIRVHLTRLRGRSDLSVEPLRRGGKAGALILHPIIRRQLAPTVRLGFAERDAPSRTAELERWSPRRPALVRQQIREVPVIDVALEAVVCPLLLAANVQDGLSCGVARPVIDRRTFQYGWEVYAVEPSITDAEPAPAPRPVDRGRG